MCTTQNTSRGQATRCRLVGEAPNSLSTLPGAFSWQAAADSLSSEAQQDKTPQTLFQPLLKPTSEKQL